MKTLTDFRKTVETGVDPRLLTDLKPLFIPSAALALKCYECSKIQEVLVNAAVPISDKLEIRLVYHCSIDALL